MAESSKKLIFRRALTLALRRPDDDSAPTRAIYLCTGPDCCRREKGLAAWRHLKARLKEKRLDRGEGRVEAHRTACMNVCGNGPIAVVYPEKTFYEKMDARNIDRVIDEHLDKGREARTAAFEPPDDVREPVNRVRTAGEEEG